MLTINVVIYGAVKVSYFPQLIIQSEFISSLWHLESDFIYPVPDAGSHRSVLLGAY